MFGGSLFKNKVVKTVFRCSGAVTSELCRKPFDVPIRTTNGGAFTVRIFGTEITASASP